MKKILIILAAIIIGGVWWFTSTSVNENIFTQKEGGVTEEDYILNLPKEFRVIQEDSQYLILEGPFLYSQQIPPGGESVQYEFRKHKRDYPYTDDFNEWARLAKGYIFPMDVELNCSELMRSNTTELHHCSWIPSGPTWYFLVEKNGEDIFSINFGHDPAMTAEQLFDLISFK